VRRLPGDEQLIFLKACPPIRAERIRYYEDADLRTRAAPHPVHDASASGAA
jgi:type IV secretory pathway TraG/TraD family ATPase VirD4